MEEAVHVLGRDLRELCTFHYICWGDREGREKEEERGEGPRREGKRRRWGERENSLAAFGKPSQPMKATEKGVRIDQESQK